MKITKIFIPYEKGNYVPTSKEFVPILVNAKQEDETLFSSVDFIKDSDGINISEKYDNYGNFTMHYYALKNEKADYIGFFSDNRYLSFFDKKFTVNDWGDVVIKSMTIGFEEELMRSYKDIGKKVEEYDMFIPQKVYLKKTVYDEYKGNYGHDIADLDCVLDILKEKYPKIYPTAKKYCNGHLGYYNGIFIMKSELFHKYAEWLFDVLGILDQRRNGENLDSFFARRDSNLAERLTGIFFEYCRDVQHYKVKELQRLLIQDMQWPQQVFPAYNSTDCSIVMSAQNEYVPYLSVAIQSIIENSNKEKKYDIVILNRNISKSNRQILIGQTSGNSNISIRFCNMNKYIEQIGNLPTHGQISIETYYRYFIMDIFKAYDKILYLDADTVCNTDLAELFSEDIEDYLVAATVDIDAVGCYNGHNPERKMYVDTELLIKEPYKYFQAGVILFNLKKCRETFSAKQLIDFSMLKHWEFLDQDVLNHFCQGQVKILKMDWDVMMNNAGIRMEIAKKAPLYLYEEYLNARKSPLIVHYAGWEKPWNIPELDMGEYFWKYARLCPYYELLLLYLEKYQLNGTKEVVNNYYVDNTRKNFSYYVRRFFDVCRKEGLKSALRKAKEKIGVKTKK